MSGPAFSQESETSEEIPTAEELDAMNLRIGVIEIDSRNIFDLDDPEEDRWLYRWANKLHVVTKPHVIRSQLLLNEGDSYSSRLVDESERILRANEYLRAASIEPLRVEDGTVDLRVSTADVWSLTPDITLGREGGENRFGLGLLERNLLGHGLLLGFKYRSDVDRDTATLDFANPHFRGSRSRLAFRVGVNSDGYDHRFFYAQPFYALDTRRSQGVSLNTGDLTQSLYDLGEIVSEFEQTYQHHEVFTGWSDGLSNGWTRRYLTGLVYDDHEFAATPETIDPSLVPANRKYVYPWFGIETVQDHFEKAENFDQIGRVEDRFLGTRFAIRVGYAPKTFGSSDDAWQYRGSFSNAIVTSKKTSLTMAAWLDGRYENGDASNLLASAQVRFHRRLTKSQLFYASISGTLGRNLDLDNQLLIGGDSGLRGYPLRYQGGDSKALITLEQRFFTEWYPWHLFNVGAAIFFDAGRTWGENPAGGPNLGLLRDVGVGLRLGNHRIGDGGVLHIDFAFPLDGEDDLDRFQILVDLRSGF
jgi:hypothetical protein